MNLLDQKISNIGEIKVDLVGGKLVIGVDGDLDLLAQLDKLAAAHTSGVLGEVLKLADEAAKALLPKT